MLIYVSLSSFLTLFLLSLHEFQNNGTQIDSLSSLPQASFNYINSIVGSGVIGIPYALHRAGFVMGLILLVIVAIITDYSLILMVRTEESSRHFYIFFIFFRIFALNRKLEIYTNHDGRECVSLGVCDRLFVFVLLEITLFRWQFQVYGKVSLLRPTLEFVCGHE